MGVVTVADLKPSISGKRSFRPSSSIRHITEWPISDVSSDLTIEVGTASFALHRIPLVSRSGRIRKLMVDEKISRISLSSNIPGGAETFELAAKFCYGINVEITVLNVANLLCAASFLEMTEEHAEKNLEARTEAYLEENVLPNISICISVLHCCESLMPIAEDINLVNRIINSIANNACKEQLTSGLSKLEPNFSTKNVQPALESSDWWGESLTVLTLNFFQRIVSSFKTKGLKQELIVQILISYAHKNLLQSQDTEQQQKKQRAIIEAIVNLLPTYTQSRKGTIPPIAFLSSLLKSAISVSASTFCRSDLERRMGMQLDQAILEDILIPANSNGNNNSLVLYDTDSIQRIFSMFLNLDDQDEDNDDEDSNQYLNGGAYEDFDIPAGSPKQRSILKVSKLMDNYLAEVALDPNLSPSKITSLAELLPHHARLVSDGLYHAVDIFLKVQPNMKESERYRLCKTIECQKLSQEACSHASQNAKLPVQMAVQILYFEQIRLRNAMNCDGSGSHNKFFFGSASTNGQFYESGCISPRRDNYASVRRENRELKLDVARMRMRLTDLEKNHESMKQELLVKTSHPANRLIKSFTKKLRRLNALFRFNNMGRSSRGQANSESMITFTK